jgi:ribosome biogenesis SPOUT family RNA methylase Rps3
MTTDTAVLVAQKVIEEQIPLDKLTYVDRPEIKLGKKEIVEMPFRYLTDDQGNPRLPEGMLELLRKSNDMCLN